MTPGTLPSGVTFTRASTATYFDSTGTMQTAATNAPRWDYDPVTLGLRGLLIEEARTNVLLRSAALVRAECDRHGAGVRSLANALARLRLVTSPRLGR